MTKINSLLLLLIFIISSCSQNADDIIETSSKTANKNTVTETSSKRAEENTVTVYHEGNLLFINKNALKGHLGHGDVQLTYVPDDNFEASLRDLGYDDEFGIEDYVLTAKISEVTSLSVYEKGIASLIGIEDFTALEELLAGINKNLTNVDLSNNKNLTNVGFRGDSKLSSLDLRNGNNINFTRVYLPQSIYLGCVNVDDADFCKDNWTGREFYGCSLVTFSEDCSTVPVIGGQVAAEE